MTTRLELWRAEAGACTDCRAHGLLHGDQVGGRARPLFHNHRSATKSVLFVLEAPNYDDTFVAGHMTFDPETDPTGAFAFELLASVGLTPKDVLITNSVLCLPAEQGDSYPVKPQQRDLCSRWLKRLIQEAAPRVVVAWGGKALEALKQIEPHRFNLKEHAGKPQAWNGLQLLPLYHSGKRAQVIRRKQQQLEDIAPLKQLLQTGVAPKVLPLTSRLRDEILTATRGRAQLRFESARGTSGDVAFTLGMLVGEQPVFAYLSRAAGPPFATSSRYYLEGVEVRAASWVLHARRMGEGSLTIEVAPLPESVQHELDQWLEAMPDDVADHVDETMKAMLDPRTL